MFDQTQIKQLIQAAEQAWYACPLQTCLICGSPKEQKIAHQTRVQKKCFKLLLESLMAFKFYQTRHLNRKMFGHQTMFDDVWSPNIYRLSRPKRTCTAISCGSTRPFAHGKVRPYPWEICVLYVTSIPTVKLPMGNHYGYIKKNKRITHDFSRFDFF